MTGFRHTLRGVLYGPFLVRFRKIRCQIPPQVTQKLRMKLRKMSQGF
jgi:hypothetical protein